MMGDGLAFSFMVGIGESYLPAFTLALGHGAITAGLVATLPMLAGAVLQLVTPAAVGLMDSHRRWVVLCASLQAASFVPLIAGALAGWMDVWLVYLSASLYWGLGMSTGPAWNVWAGTLVPPRLRARYFSLRSRGSQLSLVGALLIGGLWLQLGGAWMSPVTLFAPVFAAALLARAASASLLAAQSEARPVPIGETRISPRVIRDHVRSGGHGRLLASLLCFQLSVWIAAPFFTPYMLGPLGLSYLEFTLLTASAFLARVLALPALGRYVARAGTKRVLWLGSLGIVPLPMLWLVSDHFAWLLALQLVGGTAWAAFELASMLAFFEHIPHSGRASILTVYNLANALAIVGGATIGSLLLRALPEQPMGFVALLVLSTSSRLLCLPLLRGISDRTTTSGTWPPMRTLAIRPSSGGLQRPVMPTMDDTRVQGTR
jgi:MFS family permease